jgi:hypothetical protein
MWVENRPGGGAAFRFAIPIGSGAPQVMAAEDEAP